MASSPALHRPVTLAASPLQAPGQEGPTAQHKWHERRQMITKSILSQWHGAQNEPASLQMAIEGTACDRVLILWNVARDMVNVPLLLAHAPGGSPEPLLVS